MRAVGHSKSCTNEHRVQRQNLALGKIWHWRGPAPFYFVTVPAQQSRDLKAISGSVTYGWRMIPVTVRIGKTEWKTSLFPKEGRYLVPLKDSVRKAEQLKEGDQVTVRLEVR